MNSLFLLVVRPPKSLTAILSSRSSSQSHTQAIYERVWSAIETGWPDRYPGKAAKVIYVRFSIRFLFKLYSKQEHRAGNTALHMSDLLRVTEVTACKTVAGHDLVLDTVSLPAARPNDTLQPTKAKSISLQQTSCFSIQSTVACAPTHPICSHNTKAAQFISQCQNKELLFFFFLSN